MKLNTVFAQITCTNLEILTFVINELLIKDGVFLWSVRE